MDIQKLKFDFKESLYSCFFIVGIGSPFYIILHHFNLVSQPMGSYEIIFSYLLSIFTATAINYFLKDTYSEKVAGKGLLWKSNKN